MSEGYDFPIALNPKTGQRKQWNGTTWIDLPSSTATGGRYLPQGGQFGKDASEAANFNKWRQGQEQGVSNARSALAQDREMEGLMSRQKTGGALAVPVLGDAMAMFDPELRRMQSLQSEAARSKRTPGEGTISDFDARMFLQQVYGKDQPTETNRAIIQAGRLRSDAVIQRRQMADWYYSTYGSLRGFDEAWDRYAYDNPIFDPSTEATGRPVLNGKRQNWRQYFGASRGGGDEAPTQAQADVQRAEKRRLGQSTKAVDMDAVSPQALKTARMFSGTKGKSGTQQNPWLPVSQEEFNNLPTGSYFINPADGRVLRK